jgi:hypothetical protein
VSLEAAMRQVEARRDVNKLVLLVSILENATNTHPFIPVRLKTLREYAGSEEFQRVLAGDYKRDALGLHEGGERLKCACGTLVNSKLAFCPQCGRPVNAAPVDLCCPQCQTALPPGTRFCPKCGGKQAAAETPEASAMDQWKNTASSFFKR